MRYGKLPRSKAIKVPTPSNIFSPSATLISNFSNDCKTQFIKFNSTSFLRENSDIKLKKQGGNECRHDLK
jgi:hypothetical protein